MYLNKKSKKLSILSLLIVFLFVFNFNFLCAPKPVHAQNVDAPNLAAKIGNWVWDKINLAYNKVYKDIVAVAFKKGLQTYMNMLAQEAAKSVVAGGAGQKPLWTTDGWADFNKKAMDSAGASFIDGISKGIASSTGVFIDVCEPPGGIELKLGLQLKLSKFSDVSLAQPRCSLASMKEKWGALADKLRNDPSSLVKLNGKSLAQLTGDSSDYAAMNFVKSMVKVKESDIQYVNITELSLAQFKEEAKKLAELNRVNPDSAKPETAVITGGIKKPAQVSKEDLAAIRAETKKVSQISTGSMVADSANIFLNTLVSQGLNKLVQKLFESLAPQAEYTPVPGDNSTTGDNKGGSGGGGKGPLDTINRIFETISRISYNLTAKDVDVITELETDMGSDIISGLNNGSIDSEFAQLLRKAQSGDGLSLRDAIKENYLNGDKFFGFIDINSSASVREPSLNEGYPYTSMQKLRKARIIPAGWELAATYIYEMGQSQNIPTGCTSRGCTLENVMDQFDQKGHYYKDGEAVLDKYCGWRSLSSDPYFINKNNKSECESYGSSSNNLQTKWDGNGESNGYCYEYKTDSNGNVITIDSINATKVVCNNNQPSETSYYEWKDGGCMVKELDEAPLCGFVDPNWIMKAPIQQCRLEGYYSALEMIESSNRYIDCVDTAHCLKEDDFGNCIGGFDYCLKEKNIWRFKGDQCNSEFNTCTTLVDDKKESKSYLINTLKSCPQEEVGCREYLKNKSCDESGFCSWNEESNPIYFNSNVETCDSSNNSCNKLIEIKQGVNLVPNGSFEIDEETEGFYGYQKPDGWLNADDWQNTLGGLKDDGAATGFKYFKYNNDGADNPSNWMWMPIQIPTSGLYTLSYNVRGSGSVTAQFKFCEGDGTDCYSNFDYFFIDNDSELSFSGNLSGEWERKSGYLYITKENLENITNAHVILTSLIGDVDIDSVQFELNSFSESNNYCTRNEDNTDYFNCIGVGNPSFYTEYGNSNAKYIKTAPSYYSCDTNPSRVECSGYAKQCSSENVGCAAYYPDLKGIVPMIPAIISEDDKCPSVCNGFDTFSEFPGYFDKLEANQAGEISTSSDKNFIPSSATDCPRSEESCELFTNLDKLEKGGESKEYYNRIRQCVKPEEADATLYYTWEGSDTEAYQLKTWKVLKSNIEDSNNNEGGFAPCTNVTIGGTDCLDDGSNIIECDPSTDLDCRTFYDENAIVHNRLLSKTIPITDECIDLRREESEDKTIYKIAPSLSRKCSAKNVGCTKYDGNNAGNTRNLLMEDFESGSINGWDVSSDATVYKAPSSESVHYNGQSMKVATVGGDDDESTMDLTYTSGNISAMPGKKYILSFWAKTFSGDNVLDFFENASYENGNQSSYNIFNKAMAQSGNQILNFNQSMVVDNGDWTLYEMSIISPENINPNSSSLTLKFTIAINNTSSINGIYIDNIVLKEVQSSFYKIKDSWNTPKVCFGADNQDIPYLGCQRYTDKDNIPVYLYEFSHLCKEEYIGCKAMIDTHNSDMPFQQTFNAYCTNETNANGKECNIGKYYYKNSSNVIPANVSDSTVVVPKDNIIYVVDDDKYSCSSSNKGCSVLGVSDDSSTYYDTYLINNPDNYISSDKYGSSDKQILCLNEYKNCVAFTKPDNSRIYRIHPRGLECEYKDADLVHNKKAGFYNKDGDDCSYLLYNENYDNFSYDLANSWKPFGEYSYNNKYAAICDNESNGCSQFIDPLDNKNMRDYAATNLGNNLNFSNPNEWTKGFWDIGHSSVNLLSGTIASTTYPNRGDILDYQISQSGSNKLNMLAYKFTETNNLYNFFVNSGDIYRLGAWVKFDGNTATGTESVITFLSCRSNPSNLNNFFEGSSTPFAFPYMSSKSYVREDVAENGWHYVYGLYKIMSGSNYCSVAFYVDGVVNSHILFDDISLDKVEGDYYYINNDSIDDDSCDYPSLKEGCVLFDNTVNSNLSWNANESYLNNIKSPGDEYKSSNTNILLKVTRDRECGEWATCASQTKAFDEGSGQIKSSCISLIACDEVSSNTNSCSHPFKRSSDIKPLTLDSYRQSRGSYDWSDLDFSGYSIPGLYPIDSLSSIKTSTSSDYSLGHIVVKNIAINNNNFVYRMGIGMENPLSSPYTGTLSSPQNKSCRLYPEADSPFPWTSTNNMVSDISTSSVGYVIPLAKSSNFINANVCQPNFNFKYNDNNKIIKSTADCDCSYTKVEYGSQTLYYPLDENNVIGGIPSSINTPYETNVAIGSKTKHIGLKGYCLEYDKSYAINNTKGDNAEYRCLSWYPIEILSGEIDSYSMAQSASINNNNNIPIGAKICAIAEDWETTEDRVYCGRFNGINGYDYCNLLIFVPAGSKVNVNYYNDHLDIASKIIFGNSELLIGSTDTWLSPSDYIKEATPSDISYPIIHKVIPVNTGSATNTHHGTLELNDNKFNRMTDFGSIEVGIENFMSSDGFSLELLFSNTDGMSRFVYDNQANLTTGQNEINTYFRDDAFSLGGGICGVDCDTEEVYSGVPACDAYNGHEVNHWCSKDGWCGARRWRNRSRTCNPRKYNYYIDITSGSESGYYGQCGFNCKFSDPTDENLNNGIGCLRYGFSGYDHYHNLYNSFINGNGYFIEFNCINLADNIFPSIYNSSNYSARIADCNFVNCMENEILAGGMLGLDHSCSSYATRGVSMGGMVLSDSISCSSYLLNDDGVTLKGSDAMYESYKKCIIGGDIDGVNYGAGPQRTAYDSEAYCMCVDGTANCCNSCTASTTSWDGSSIESSCTPGTSCVQSCLSYFDLENVVFDANRFYLNKVVHSTDDAWEKCNFSGHEGDGGRLDIYGTSLGWICPPGRSNNPSKYAWATDVSYDTIWSAEIESSNNGVFENTGAPFASFIEDDEDIKFTIQGDENASDYIFYSNSKDLDLKDNAGLTNFTIAKNKLKGNVINVPDSNFKYKLGDDWLPVSGATNLPSQLSGLTSDYWDFRNNTNPPIIKLLEYDEENNDVLEGDDSGISINSIHGRNIISNEGSIYASLSFYAYTAMGREPIKNIKIDWENGVETTLQGPFKNHKHDCDRKCGSDYNDAFLDNSPGDNCYKDSDCNGGSCFGKTWGDTIEACMEDNKDNKEIGYFSYNYIYSCDPLNNAWIPSCSQYGIPGGCCVYTPIVTVTDNWGTFTTANLGTCDGNLDCSIIITPR